MSHHILPRAVGRLTAAAVAVLGLGALTASAQALPVDAPASPRLAARADADCGLSYNGVSTKTGHIVSRLIQDGTFVEENVGSLKFPKNTVGRGYVGYERGKRLTRSWYHVLRADGRARVYEFTLRNRDDSLKDVAVIPGRTNSFSARTYTTNQGYWIFAGTKNGSLFRYTNFRDRSGKQYYGGRARLLGKSAPTLDSLVYAFDSKLGGVKRHVLFATTHGGGLARITVPVGRTRGASLRIVTDSGFEGTTELSFGGCSSSPTRIPLVASNPKDDTAVYAEIPNFKKNLRVTTPTEIEDTFGWDVFDGVR